MRIDYLANQQRLLPAVARAHFEEWGHFRPERTLEERTQGLLGCCGYREVPTVLVAVAQGQLLGTAMLIAHDMETRPELSPWLAGVYVNPNYRRRGLATALIERVILEAATIGVTTLYLYTEPHLESFYRRLGWQSMEKCEYRGIHVVIMSLNLAGK